MKLRPRYLKLFISAKVEKRKHVDEEKFYVIRTKLQ